MHKNFAEWYRLVAIEPEDGMLKKRWAGIEEWCKIIVKGKTQSALDTVRIFCGHVVDQIVMNKFVESFRKHDAAFPQRNKTEIQVLAGAAATNIMLTEKDDGDLGTTVALALATSHLRAAGIASRIPEIDDIAQNYLIQEGRHIRNRDGHSIDELAEYASAVDAIKSLSETSTNNDETSVVPILHGLAKAIHHLHSSLSNDISRVDEECNMLWWLEGGCSRDLKAPWEKLNKDTIPIIAAKELADLTEYIPGPSHAPALLHRIVSNMHSPTVTIANSINALPEQWIEAAIDSRFTRNISDMTPIWLAMRQRAETSDMAAWQPYFEKRVNVSVTKEMPRAELALQAYLEALLIMLID